MKKKHNKLLLFSRKQKSEAKMLASSWITEPGLSNMVDINITIIMTVFSAIV